MKITDVKPFPLWSGNRNFFFVKVETDEGVYGVGEGGLTWRELAVAECVQILANPYSAPAAVVALLQRRRPIAASPQWFSAIVTEHQRGAQFASRLPNVLPRC